jgi:hypothetical protein
MIEKRENNKFDRLRTNMICESFGLSFKDLESYRKDYEYAISDDSHLNDDRMSKLGRLKAIWQGQKGANKNDAKGTAYDLIGGASGLAMGALIASFPKIAELIAQFTLPAPISTSIKVIGLVYGYYKYKKRMKGNLSDQYGKEDDYTEELIKFIKDSERLSEVIVNDREALESAKSSMSKNDFKAYQKEYLKTKLAELGIESPLLLDPEVSQEFDNSNVSSINDKLNQFSVNQEVVGAVM